MKRFFTILIAILAFTFSANASMIDLTGKKEQPWQYQFSASVTQNIWDGGVIDASDLLQKINEESNASLQKSIHQIELLQALYRQEKMGNE